MKKGRTVKQAVELFESFRERKPTRIGRVTLKVPTVVAAMGYVEGIDYRTTHGKKTELYHHDFAPGSRPLLAVSADGRQILLMGGRYKWTERGIVDRDRNDREIENEDHGKVIKPRKGNPARQVIDGAALAKMLAAELKAVKAGKIPVRTPAQDALMAQYAAALRQVSQATYAAGKATAARKTNARAHGKAVHVVDTGDGGRVEVWWDAYQKLYTLQRFDGDGYQVGPTQYQPKKPGAVADAADMATQKWLDTMT